MKVCLAWLISIRNECFSCHLPGWDSAVAKESAESLLMVLRTLLGSVLLFFYEKGCGPQVTAEPTTELGRKPRSWFNGLSDTNPASASGFCSKRRHQVCCCVLGESAASPYLCNSESEKLLPSACSPSLKTVGWTRDLSMYLWEWSIWKSLGWLLEVFGTFCASRSALKVLLIC